MGCNKNIKFFLDGDNMLTLCNPLNGEAGLSFSILPAIWWFILSSFSIFYLYQAFLMLNKKNNDSKKSPKQLQYCASIYIFACAVRSIWPRIDVERICFFDSWISYPIVGRSLATIAEVCFAHQIAYVLGSIATQLKCYKINSELKLVVPLIIIAQTCCWFGVTTQKQLWHSIEESMWLIVMQVCGVFALYMSTLIDGRSPINGKVLNGSEKAIYNEILSTKYKLQLSFLLSICFSIFMFYIDVPMYFERYNQDERNNKTYLTFIEGVYDSTSCKLISKHMNEWAPEMPWLSGYFIGATFLSLKLTTIPKVVFENDKSL